jgi:hypothetical protein
MLVLLPLAVLSVPSLTLAHWPCSRTFSRGEQVFLSFDPGFVREAEEPTPGFGIDALERELQKPSLIANRKCPGGRHFMTSLQKPKTTKTRNKMKK